MSQAMVLEFLNNTSDVEFTPKAIEQHFNLRHPTVSGILKRLEKNGFITTTVNSLDRRAKDIHLTPKANEIDKKAKQHQAHLDETFVKGFTQDEIETLRKLLLRVQNNITNE
jgi:DNA-binding MarR family transcriptional regulator